MLYLAANDVHQICHLSLEHTVPQLKTTFVNIDLLFIFQDIHYYYMRTDEAFLFIYYTLFP